MYCIKVNLDICNIVTFKYALIDVNIEGGIYDYG